MTFRESCEHYLVQLGMWPDEAESIVVEEEKSNAAFAGRWDDDVSGYPQQMLSVLYIGLRASALEWIDENKPMHFARRIFV